MATAVVHTSHEGKGPSSVLLDLFGYIGPSRNATTATSKTSAGLPIAVTFCAAHPPVLSHFSVDCPACPEPKCLSLAPKVIAADADLVLLRVPVDRSAKFSVMFNDYFVYRVHSQRPKLDLLPTSAPYYFQDQEIVILSCGDGSYAVASIQSLGKSTFTLHLYRSLPNGDAGTWTSKVVDVEEPLRHKVCLIPSSSGMPFCHQTTNVITLGGAKGTVGWVDLWRGILLCDLLEESPKLRDMPLPLPSKGNWNVYLDGCPYFSRNIIVNQRKDTIKYVEMEISLAANPPVFPSSSDRYSYYEWLSREECPAYFLVPTMWKATTWSMPIPVTSWDGWKPRCSVLLTQIDIPADVTMHYKQLMSATANNEGKAAEGILFLGCLRMAYPTMSMADDDDDIVYLLARAPPSVMVLAIDIRMCIVRGVAKLPERHLGFMRYFLASGISIYPKTTGSSENLGQTEVQDANVCDQESRSGNLGELRCKMRMSEKVSLLD